ncbi:aspartyl protease family protein [Sphingomonas colocasiae]|uniref:Aspartyl protease family protein n=1 Tax=Sphingomonas colocasiae TaxID=1848973 RepID=A0ABS7PQ35_9SPHN|nr:aspartyl protease family protein [Sphingomonas colocasiae]MBY8823432.1 aspartyl protease family protein [Sphingomonas colocasiae]
MLSMPAPGIAAPPPVARSPVTIALGDYLGVLKTAEIRIGDERATMILDTGGGITVITPEFARRIGCKPWGQLSGSRMSGERLTMQRCARQPVAIAGQELGPLEMGVFDLARILPADAPRVDGVLSLDAFASVPLTLELEAARLTIETPDSVRLRTSAAAEIPMRLHRQAGGASLTVMAAVPAAPGDLWMQIDSGSDAPLQLPPSSASALGVEPGAGEQVITLFAGTAAGRDIAVAAKARVRDMIIDGNIGIAVLRNWVMTFDFAGERLWIRRATTVDRAQPAPGPLSKPAR